MITEKEQLHLESKLGSSDNNTKVEAQSEVDDQQSIDSGIGSSYSGSTQASLKGRSASTGTEPVRPTTIFEVTDSSSNTAKSEGTISQRGSDSSLLLAHNSLVTEKSCKRAITPPPRPPPRSLHSDMYDTVFMLQALKGGGGAPSPEGDTSVTDYLTKVRTIWDDQYKSPSKRFSIGPTHAEIPSEEEVGLHEAEGDLGRERTRASSEPKLLEAVVSEELIDFDTGKSSDKSIAKVRDVPDATETMTTKSLTSEDRNGQDEERKVKEDGESSIRSPLSIHDQGNKAAEVPEVPKRKKNMSRGGT